ncbi:MAG: aldehyde dehydrogenase family protein [Acidimicrobiales bacterium]|nr:aldehyde dehydrogenase family protein [Acidimicrobiales bacterium]
MTTFRSVNPARPDDVVGEYPTHGAADVDAAVARAAAAQREWARRPAPARADVIAAAGRVIARDKEAFTALVSREAGKVLVEAGGDVQEAVDMAWFVAGQGRAAWGATVPSELGDKLCWTTRQPVGVVGMITPWNFPIAIPSWKIFPALLAGNGVVIKPSEHAPACCAAFVAACVEAGVPADLVQVVHGFAEPAAALAVHPGVQAVSFTGSVPTGRKVAAAAMETGPRLLSLELGGKNAMVVRADADLDLAVEGAVFGAFGTSGQRCTSTSRLIVHPDVAGELVERIVKRSEQLRLGDPQEPGVDVGPVITGSSTDRIAGMVATAVDEGATVATGGRPVTVEGCDGGAFFAPTVLTGVRPEHRIAREEVFGPVLAVLEVAGFDEALEVVNSVEYGLSAAVYTRDISAALRAVDGIDTGIVYVNAPTIGAEIPLPFGGTKHTGNGFREAGTRGIEQFSQVKTVYVDYSGRLQKAQIDTHPLGEGA